jgi:hypothetical protein
MSHESRREEKRQREHDASAKSDAELQEIREVLAKLAEAQRKKGGK